MILLLIFLALSAGTIGKQILIPNPVINGTDQPPVEIKLINVTKPDFKEDHNKTVLPVSTLRESPIMEIRSTSRHKADVRNESHKKFKAAIPNDIKAILKPVVIKTEHGNPSSVVLSLVKIAYITYSPPTPFMVPVAESTYEGRMYAGRAITIHASTTKQAQWFTINLGSSGNKGDEDIAFHLSFRLNQSVVVRNHLQILDNGVRKWGSEEKGGRLPIARGEPFQIMLVCEEDAFKVLINGTYFTEFKHRIPYQAITRLNFEQQIEVQNITFKNTDEVTPFTYPIPGGMYPGRVIRVLASRPMSAERAYINLQSGPSTDRKDVAFGLGFRFTENLVEFKHNLISSNGVGTWGSEMNEVIHIEDQQLFEVMILCQEKVFKVFINDTHVNDFKHVLPYQNITHLNFGEEIMVRSVRYNYNAEAAPLIYPIPGGTYPKRTIRIQVSTSEKANWFAINLQSGPSIDGKDDIALHLSFRFNQSVVVRNHLQILKGVRKWGAEEREGGLPIARGEPFEIMLLCAENFFKVFINDNYFTEFQHRIPYQRITHLIFRDQVTVESIRF